MARRILHVIQTAYRGTLEEQDDTTLWLVQALKGAGAEPHVLLCGSAVNYLARGQDASGLRFGDRAQTQPPAIEADLQRMSSKGIELRYVAEDALERGLEGNALVPGAAPVARAEVPRLFEKYEQVWQW
jgi:sulfur relay (sulfurtransferase) DsrF/TusC family protein